MKNYKAKVIFHIADKDKEGAYQQINKLLKSIDITASLEEIASDE